MAKEPIDALQIKIEQAKAKLPEDTLNAINAVDWKADILSLREKKGYTFEQLEDLEIETELMLCGLLSSFDYPRELEKRMGISKAQVDELVNEMNALVFSRIKSEMIKNIDRKRIFESKPATVIPVTQKTTLPNKDTDILSSHGIEIIERNLSLAPEKLEIGKAETPKKVSPVLVQKLGGSLRNPLKQTEHSLGNISPTGSASVTPKSDATKADPYREIPE